MVDYSLCMDNHGASNGCCGYKDGKCHSFENCYYKHELRDEEVERFETIDEVAEIIKKELNQYDFWHYDIIVDGCVEEKNVSRNYLIDDIACRMKNPRWSGYKKY